MECTYPTCSNLLTGRRKKFCSYECKNKYHVTLARRNIKARLVEHFGGKCILCGYNKSLAALQFHHPDNNKEFGIASGGYTRSYAKALAEAEKCVLICANCHAEEHERIRHTPEATVG